MRNINHNGRWSQYTSIEQMITMDDDTPTRETPLGKIMVALGYAAIVIISYALIIIGLSL